jgi:ElaB/YqjD/DUF883 family membrane-anchored ribosome-binding protein
MTKPQEFHRKTATSNLKKGTDRYKTAKPWKSIGWANNVIVLLYTNTKLN